MHTVHALQLRAVGADPGEFQAFDLDRVAERGACPVGLDITDRRAVAGPAVGCGDDLRLRRGTRCGQRVRMSPVRDRRARDDPVHRVTAVQGVAEAAQHDGADSFAAHVTVRRRVEGRAPPPRGEHARIVEGGEPEGGQERIHTADDRQVALAGAQRHHGPVQRDEGARARGIDRLAGTMQVEQVGDAVGNNGVHVASRQVSHRHGSTVLKPMQVVVQTHTGEDARPGAAQG